MPKYVVLDSTHLHYSNTNAVLAQAEKQADCFEREVTIYKAIAIVRPEGKGIRYEMLKDTQDKKPCKSSQ